MENLIAYLSQYSEVSVPLSQRISSYVEKAPYKKGMHLLEIGDTAKYLYFLESGFARGVRRVNGKLISTWFWKEGDLVTSIYSFLKQEPTDEGIELLEDCRAYRLSYSDLQLLYEEFIEFNIIGRKTLEAYFLKAGEITYALRNLTAIEKYEYLLALHPDIFQRTTLNNIASYLGISKETMSRIRKPYRN
ncbi:MAG: Crp/Fnr family transcriptional regulator [Bacteroidota bacterium]